MMILPHADLGPTGFTNKMVNTMEVPVEMRYVPLYA